MPGRKHPTGLCHDNQRRRRRAAAMPMKPRPIMPSMPGSGTVVPPEVEEVVVPPEVEEVVVPPEV